MDNSGSQPPMFDPFATRGHGSTPGHWETVGKQEQCWGGMFYGKPLIPDQKYGSGNSNFFGGSTQGQHLG